MISFFNTNYISTPSKAAPIQQNSKHYLPKSGLLFGADRDQESDQFLQVTKPNSQIHSRVSADNLAELELLDRLVERHLTAGGDQEKISGFSKKPKPVHRVVLLNERYSQKERDKIYWESIDAAYQEAMTNGSSTIHFFHKFSRKNDALRNYNERLWGALSKWHLRILDTGTYPNEGGALSPNLTGNPDERILDSIVYKTKYMEVPVEHRMGLCPLDETEEPLDKRILVEELTFTKP